MIRVKMDIKKRQKFVFSSLFILLLSADLQAAGLFGDSPQVKSPFIKPNPPIKTLPKDSVQRLVVPQDSEYSKIYQMAIQDPTINSRAVNAAFKFFMKNKDRMVPKDLCLSKDNKENRAKIRNRSCLIIADYTKSKLSQRLHILKLDENKIYNLYTAHGKGSNINKDDQMATKFSNTSGSLQTSLGFFLTAETYTSYKDTFGPGPNNGIKLDGLSCSNNKARSRYVVLHTAKYVREEAKENSDIGYSEGCVTVAPSYKEVILSCANGTLVYAHGPK